MELTTPAPSRDTNAARVTHRRDGLRMRAGTGRDVAARTFSLVLKIVPPSMQKDDDDMMDHRQQQRISLNDAAPAVAMLGSQEGASGIAAGSRGVGDSLGAEAPGGSGASVGTMAAQPAPGTGMGGAAAAAPPAARPPPPPRQHTPRLGAREPRTNFTADLEDEEDVNNALNAIAGGGAAAKHGGNGGGSKSKSSLGYFAVMKNAAAAMNDDEEENGVGLGRDARRVSAAPDVIRIDMTPGTTGGSLGAATPASAAAGSDVMIPLVPYADTPESFGNLGGPGDRLGGEGGGDASVPRSAPGTGASAYELAGAGARAVAITPGFTPNGRPVLRLGNRSIKEAEAAAVAGRVNAVDPTPANTPWNGVPAEGADAAAEDTPDGGSRGNTHAGGVDAVTPGLEGLAPGEPIEDDEDNDEAPGSAVTVTVNVEEEEGGEMRCSRRPGADEPPLVDISNAVDAVGGGGFDDDDNDFGGGFGDAGMDDADAFFGVGGETPARGFMVDGGNDPMTGGLDAVGGKKKRKRGDGPSRPRGTPHKLERKRYERRKSLATAGMRDDLEDEEGRPVRRSTRQRTRPLEYWRGETKNYERAHQSLPTVKAVATRTPNPKWPLTKTPHAEDKVHGKKGEKRGRSGAASRKASEEARKRALRMADVAHMSDSDEEEDDDSEDGEENDHVSLASRRRKVSANDAAEAEEEEEEAEEEGEDDDEENDDNEEEE